MTKATYETPKLVEIGSFETVTQGGANGNTLDRVFPSGTPRGELTFS